MTDLDRHEVRAIWRALAQRNNWELVRDTDEETFLDEVTAEWHRLQGDDSSDGSVRIAIIRMYSALRFRCFCGYSNRDDSNQAADEIRTAVFRIARRRGWEAHDAEDLAQETTERMYSGRHKVGDPAGLNTYMYRVFQTVQRDYLKRTSREAPIPTNSEGEQLEIRDDAQTVDVVEQAILNDTIAAHIRAAIPNEIERIVLLRILLWNEHPRDVARALGLDLAYTRVIKSRAAKRLKKDERFKTLVRELLSGRNLELSTTGDDSDEAQTDN